MKFVEKMAMVLGVLGSERGAWALLTTTHQLAESEMAATEGLLTLMEYPERGGILTHLDTRRQEIQESASEFGELRGRVGGEVAYLEGLAREVERADWSAFMSQVESRITLVKQELREYKQSAVPEPIPESQGISEPFSPTIESAFGEPALNILAALVAVFVIAVCWSWRGKASSPSLTAPSDRSLYKSQVGRSEKGSRRREAKERLVREVME